MTPSEWTRWRLRSAAASFLFILEAKARDIRDFAVAFGEERRRKI